jgi:hypothetical protein
MTGASAKLVAALAECRLHADVLVQAWQEVQVLLPFDAATASAIRPEQRRLLDQIAYRFGRLQDSLGEKLLPGLLVLAQEPIAPEATFAEKLQRLERLGAVDSANDWKLLREMRNALAHDYPDAPELQAAWLNRLVASIPILLAMAQTAQVFALRCQGRG